LPQVLERNKNKKYLIQMKNSRQSSTGIFCLFLSIAVCLCGFSGCKQNPQQPTTGETYKTMQVSLTNASVSTHYSASIKGKQYVEIRPQVSGLITEISIDEGAAVRKGQTLFVIDQVPYRAALETATASVMSADAKVATAQLVVDNKRELFNENVISEHELQTAQNSLQEAKATLAQAKASEVNARNNLSYTMVKSPVDGIAGMISYRVGALVNSSISEPLVTVSSEDEMNAYFSMTENQLLALVNESGTIADIVKTMPPVKLQLSNGSPYEIEGRIDAVSGTIDARTGAISVRARFSNPKHLLRTGSAATVIIPYEKKNCIIIPKGATYEIQDKTYVYKVVDGKATSAEIVPFKINNGTEYIVESGLNAGDIIVSAGAGLLREGTTIAMKNEELKIKDDLQASANNP
jgi:membrane fusion protein (multidrug efflux system)